jgi:hypothetical protein
MILLQLSAEGITKNLTLSKMLRTPVSLKYKEYQVVITISNYDAVKNQTSDTLY